ncbi:hypothetical protein [Loigolactobacillus binensis]|uniref:hypothetical protein n=1 Tax=Loigolactobacillus binensis TaxID=2559922 RepID=UPI001484FD9F|nr:hypothetical protein [Loigolactobacillus binensis]
MAVEPNFSTSAQQTYNYGSILFPVDRLQSGKLLTGFFVQKRAHSPHPKNPPTTVSFKRI